MIDQEVLKEITRISLNYVYSGENERPVRALNFRSREAGGLGLMNPTLKCRAFMLKSMNKEFNKLENDENRIIDLYGYKNDFRDLLKENCDLKDVSSIYNILIRKETYKNGLLIPSRAELRAQHINWELAWHNLRTIKGIGPEEKCFMFKVQQDLLPVGTRMHRKGADKRCLANLNDDATCTELEDRKHALLTCPTVMEKSTILKEILGEIFDRHLDDEEILYFSYYDRDKNKKKAGLWIAIKMLYCIHYDRNMNKVQLLRKMLKEINWNLQMNIKEHVMFSMLKTVISNRLI